MKIISYYANNSNFDICCLLIASDGFQKIKHIRKGQNLNVDSSSVPYDAHGFRSFMHGQFYTKLDRRNTI